jgi:hypothetical protein
VQSKQDAPLGAEAHSRRSSANAQDNAKLNRGRIEDTTEINGLPARAAATGARASSP